MTQPNPATGQQDPNNTGQNGAPGTSGASGSADDWTPPTREEFEALQQRLTKVNGEAAKWRLRAKGASTGTSNGSSATSASDGKGNVQVTPATDAATARTLEHLKRTAINAQVRSELVAAGFANATKDRVARAIRLIDTTAIELDDDGEIDGLDEQIEVLKQDFPEFFAAPGDETPGGKPRPRASRSVTTGGRSNNATAETENDQLFKRTGASASRWADIATGRIQAG